MSATELSEQVEGLRTVDELAAAAGVTVRTVRFYATKGLLPPPLLRGRTGLYGPDHLARLVLVRDLQAKGFTLQAIERFLERMPADASPADVAVYGALLSPWVADPPEELTRAQLAEFAGPPLSDEDLDALAATGVVEVLASGRCLARPADLELGLQLVDLAVPREMLERSRELIDGATTALAEDLAELLREHLFRPYVHGELPPDQRAALSEVIARLRPLTIQAVVQAMQRAVDRAVRDRVDRA
ncbi:MAG: MerR family transcriptional regulator [Nitriliruptor sp.]